MVADHRDLSILELPDDVAQVGALAKPWVAHHREASPAATRECLEHLLMESVGGKGVVSRDIELFWQPAKLMPPRGCTHERQGDCSFRRRLIPSPDPEPKLVFQRSPAPVVASERKEAPSKALLQNVESWSVN